MIKRNVGIVIVLLTTFRLCRAVFDPASNAIKTKSYQTSPMITNDSDNHYQQQPQKTYTTRLSRVQSGGNTPGTSISTNNKFQYQQQSDNHDTYEHQQSQQYDFPYQQYKHKTPLYERQTVKGRNWDNSESIAEYNTMCPPGYTGQLPYAYDCRRFINCWHGRQQIQSCSAGTVFNPETQECDRPDKVVCGTSNALDAGNQQPTTKQHKAKYYSENIKDSTENINSLCSIGTSGLQAHPYNCSRFLNCANGNAYVQECGPGTAYSIPMMVCDFKHKVDCTGRDFVDYKGSTEDLKIAKSLDGMNYEKHEKIISPQRNIHLSFTSTLNYCEFKKETGSKQSVQNPDWTVQVCASMNVDPPNTYSAFDILCPNGVTGHFVHPFDYTKFLNCKNGHTAIQNCLPEMVFSISKGFCDTTSNVGHTDHVPYFVSEVNYEYSKMLVVCPPKTEGMHLYPYDCKNYLECDKNGRMLISECPSGKVFSISRRQCFEKYEVKVYDRVKYSYELSHPDTPTGQTNITTQSQTNGYNRSSAADTIRMVGCSIEVSGQFPHPFDSTKYLQCNNGELRVEKCPSGSEFSLSKKECCLTKNLKHSNVALYDNGNVDEWLVYEKLNDGPFLSCPSKISNGMFLYPFDGTKFIRCLEGNTQVEICGGDAVFSISQRKCLDHDQVEAFDHVEYPMSLQNEFSSVESVCDFNKHPHELIPHPIDPQKYLRCSIDGYNRIESCPAGMFFNNSKRACDLFDIGEHRQVACPLHANGIHPHPYDCTKYLICGHGITEIKNCATGTVWNADMEVCVFKEKDDCMDRWDSKIYVARPQISTESLANKENNVKIFCPKDIYHGHYPHPFDNTKYFHCQHGQSPIKSCRHGTVFSISRRVCDRIHEVSSSDRTVGLMENIIDIKTQNIEFIVCPPTAIGEYLYPFDSTKYIRCSNGRTVIRECSYDRVFNMTRQACVSRTRFSSIELERLHGRKKPTTFSHWTALKLSECPEGASGTFPYPYDCSKFLNCTAGMSNVQSCAPGMAWSERLKVCDWKEKVDCTDRSQNSLLVDAYPDAKITKISCPGDVGEGFYPHPFDFKLYFICQNGQSVISQCSQGNAFSISKRFCDFEEKVSLTDRVILFNEHGSDGSYMLNPNIDVARCPVNAPGIFLSLYPFDCSKYIKCDDGATLIKSCPTGSSYSISSKICISTDLIDRTERVASIAETHDNLYYWQNKDMNILCPLGIIGYVKHPYDASKFLDCSNGRAVVKSCFPGQVFYIEQCQNGDVFLPKPIETNEPKCPSNANGLYPHPNDCTKFLNCDNGKAHVESCASGTAWNSKAQNCDFYHKVDCQNYHGSKLRPTNFSETLVQGFLTGCLLSETHLFPHPYDCTKFFNCVNEDIHIRSCGPGTAFNSAIGVCDFIAHVDCSNRETWNKTTDNQHTYNSSLDTGKTETYKDRWSNMNIERPERRRKNGSRTILANSSVPSEQQQHHTNFSDGNRSALGSSKDHLSPTQNFMIIEGSLEPTRDYISTMNAYGVPLAPLALSSNTTTKKDTINIYYTRESFEQSASKNDFSPHVSSIISQPSRARNINNLGQSNGISINTDQTHTRNELQNEVVPDVSSNLFGGLRPASIGASAIGLTQVPYDDSKVPKSTTLPESSRLNPSVGRSETNSYSSVQLLDKEEKPHSFEKNIVHKVSTISPHSYSRTNVRVHQLYPPLNNTANIKAHGSPYYSLPYSGVAHSYNTTWKSTNLSDESYQNIDTTKQTNQTTTETVQRTPQLPPPFNRQYYQGTSSSPSTVSTVTNLESDLPISDALRLLLRPYINRTGIVSEDNAYEAESHIMHMVAKTKNSIMSTTTTPKPPINTRAILPTSIESPATFAAPIRLTKPVDKQRSIIDNVEPILIKNGPTDGNADFYKNQKNSELTGVEAYEHNLFQTLSNPNLPSPFVAEEGKEANNEKALFVSSNSFFENSTISPMLSLQPRVSGTNEDCQFECGNNKCITLLEVCNGVNNCGNRRDEMECDHLGYQVRLSGGDSPNMGQIEISVLGKWGYVCDDKFGLRDADVACREIGFKLGASEVRGNSYYPPREESFYFAMDEVDCRGNETSLKDCDFKGWGVHNCGPDEVVGVVCKVPLLKCPSNYWLCSTSKECIPPAFLCDNTPDCADQSDESYQVCNSAIEYRLEGGRDIFEGRLEVKYHGEWGTICDDDFGITEAQVLCNSLGFYGEPTIEKNIYGPGNGPIWLDQVSCMGNETSIDKCNHWSWGEHNCNHTEDVAIRCVAGLRSHSFSNNNKQKINQNDIQFPLDLQQKTLVSDEYSQYPLERSSKFLRTQPICGHFKSLTIDEYAHPEERVINGSIAKRGRHPWQATIRTRGRGGISSHWCGAVLITDGNIQQSSHLLTAAHCLAGYQKGAYFIRIGDHYANIAESSEIDSFIENWYIHEKFRDKTHMNNDIALIVLKNPVRFNDYIQPVCLPDKGSTLPPGRQCTISGWGSIRSGISTPSNILRSASVPILSDDTCKQSHVYGDSLTEGMFCAGSMDESVDACDGDSGGPLVCSDDGAETLYGIISWGQHCGYANKPGVYVRIEKYVDWINEKLNFSLKKGASIMN